MKQTIKQPNKQAGGYARAAALSPERRQEIARNAVLTRWGVIIDKKPAISDELQTNDGNISGAFVSPQT